ncbi:MAG: universal stress protein UspA [Xanthomonadales bacterium]|nr:universal stress protein UspA [Xanthomonadales bacterium]|tara:strand:- start:1129 stop:1563 length:435 start_codon:yes stop_codon:yes gene_type:complete
MSTAKEILVPVDGSQNALRAVRYALGLAGALGARIRLFYVFPVSSVEIIGMAGMSRDDIEHAAQAAAQRVFDKLHAEIGETDVKLVDETSIGDPAEEIIRCTEDDHELLVILGRRGLSRIQSLLLGSVSEKVVRHAHSPVTVIV